MRVGVGIPSLNVVEIEADEEESERIVQGVAQGEIDKASVAEFFHKYSQYSCCHVRPGFFSKIRAISL